MTYQPSHRKPREPRWHDRPRAWLAAVFRCTRWQEEDAPWCASPWCSVAPEPHPRQPGCPGGDHRDYVGFYPDDELTDDNGEPIARDLPPVERCCVCGSAEVGYHNYRDQPFCWPCADGEPAVIRTAKVSGVHLPLSGGDVNPWVNCAFAKDAWPSGVQREGRAFPGLNHAPELPRPETGTGGKRQVAERGPGHLSMFDLIPVRDPWPPLAWPPILSGPRIRPELRTALPAGAT